MRKTITGNSAHRILVVDDDPFMCDYLRALLAAWDYAVATSRDATTALQLLGSDQAFDLLFTDIRLRDALDGWELARRARLLRPDLRILFTSASADFPDGKIMGQYLGDKFLLKPFNPRDLVATMRLALADP